MTRGYPFASTGGERKRLKLQSEALVPITQRMLSAAGITAGSRVLELGCGSGEVTRLIAARVGPTGEVVAVDRDGAQMAAASAQLGASGHDNVRFVVTEIDGFEPAGSFDAVVGRYILMYVPDPESVLRKAAGWLGPGGSMAFIELDLFRGARTRLWPPPLPQTARAIEFIGDVMLDAGIHAHMGARLPSILSRYGQVHCEAVVPLQFGAASIEIPLEAVRSVQPVARKLGRADADAHDVDRLLADEMKGRDEHTVMIPPASITAWVRVTKGFETGNTDAPENIVQVTHEDTCE